MKGGKGNKVLPIFRGLHSALLPLVTCHRSNQIISSFQSFFGLSQDGKVGNWPLFYFFKLASGFGEDCYFLPFIFWFANELSFAFATDFLLALLAGQVTKDLLHLPRPPKFWIHNGKKTSIAKMEEHFSSEYGFPSTHTLCGLLPLSLVLSLVRLGVSYSDLWLHFVACVVYVVCVACSRMYVGVHSPADICGGLSIGLFLLTTTHFMLHPLDDMVYTSQYGFVIAVTVIVVFMRYYPAPRPWRASFGTAATVCGLWFGLAVGLWAAHFLHPAVGEAMNASSRLALPSKETTALPPLDVLVAAKKVLIGISLAGVNKVVFKIVPTKIFLALRKAKCLPSHPEDEVDADGVAVPDHKTYWVDVPVRFINYSALGFGIVFMGPYLWIQCGLM